MRYLQIPDIRDTRTWRNPNAARLYMWLAMVAAQEGGGYKYSRRWTCQQIGITEDAYRHALKVIEADGLIKTLPPNLHPKQHPREHPSPPPHITVVSVSELYGGSPPNNTPGSTPGSTPDNAPILNKNINKKYYLTLARAKAPSLVGAVAEYIHTSPGEARVAVKAFLDAMAHKCKVWDSEEDFVAHLMDWALKRWTGVESRTAAANKQQERQERHEQQQQQQAPRRTEEDEQRDVTQWLTGALRSETVRSVLDGRIKAGWLWDDKVRTRVVRALDETDGLREHLTEALGYDILRQKTINYGSKSQQDRL